MGTFIHVEMLGGLVVHLPNREIHRFRTQKTASLLAFLVLHKQQSHPRDVLIEQFWPASALDAGRTNLSVALNALRRHLEEPGVSSGSIVIADRLSVRLTSVAFTSDVDEFEAGLRVADAAIDPQQRLTYHLQALDHYRGDLLPGFYDDWVLTERERLRDAYLASLKQTVRGQAAFGRYDEAVECCHRMVQADPVYEGAHHNLMRLYVALGRPGDAVAQFSTLEEILRRELQTVPSKPVRDLAERLRASTPAVRRGARRNLIEKNDVDFDSALISNEEKPKPTIVKIPFHVTPFFGREHEISRLRELFGIVENEQYRPVKSQLLTLTGPGGTGKTRLSVELAVACVTSFKGGIWLISLADVADIRLIGSAVRDSLSLPRSTAVEPLDQAIRYLHEKSREGPVLIILDNFEHLVNFGNDTVEMIMAQVPSISILVTSRRSLCYPGEREFQVPQLPVPNVGHSESGANIVSAQDIENDLSAIAACPSVALFVNRAQAVNPDFQVTHRNAADIVSICCKLDGLPLALELAAARTRAMTPAQILQGASSWFDLLVNHRANKDERHRSLHSVMQWSYDQLSPSVRQFFSMLAVFAGGFTADAAAIVCNQPHAIELLEQLQIDSLVLVGTQCGEMRFRMLETIREFAEEQLSPEDMREARLRHAAYFQQMVCGHELNASNRAEWFERYSQDLDNLRALLRWSVTQEGETEIGLRVAGGLTLFWKSRGHIAEGHVWCNNLLKVAHSAPTDGLAWSLYGAGALAAFQGDTHAARPLLERCLEVVTLLGDEARLGVVHNELGSAYCLQGDYDQAVLHFEKSLKLSRLHARPDDAARALGNLANVASSRGDTWTACQLNRECLAVFRETGDRTGESTTLHNLANLSRRCGNLEDARSCYEQSLTIRRELHDRYGVSSSLAGLASVAMQMGESSSALDHILSSLELARELNAQVCLITLLTLMIAMVRQRGDLKMAAQMYGAAEGIREVLNYPIRQNDRASYDKGQTELRESLGDLAFDAARSSGKGLSLASALAILEQTLLYKSL